MAESCASETELAEVRLPLKRLLWLDSLNFNEHRNVSPPEFEAWIIQCDERERLLAAFRAAVADVTAGAVGMASRECDCADSRDLRQRKSRPMS
jgi:hypothetical protein